MRRYRGDSYETINYQQQSTINNQLAKQSKTIESKLGETKPMPKLKIRLDDVEVPKALPNGQYLVKVESCELKDAKETETKFLSIIFSVAEQGEFFGKKIYHTATYFIDSNKDPDGSKTKTAQGYLREMLEHLKFKWEPDGFDPDDLKGKKAIANVITEQYQGRDGNKIQRLAPIK